MIRRPPSIVPEGPPTKEPNPTIVKKKRLFAPRWSRRLFVWRNSHFGYFGRWISFGRLVDFWPSLEPDWSTTPGRIRSSTFDGRRNLIGRRLPF